MLTAERKCPHDGACEIDAARTGKTSGTQQLTGWIYDDGAGSGTERTPYQAHTGGIQGEGSSRNSSRQQRSQPCQCYTEHTGDRSSTSGSDQIRRSQPHAPERVAEGARGYRHRRDTLRRILTNAGVNSPRRRRPPKHRVRRQRMPREGMLIQVDGSYHRWLGKDGPQFTLLLAIDDATGIVVNALFCELGEHPQLLLAPRWTNKALRHTDRALCGPACRIQVHSTVGSCRCSNPVQSCDGRAWRTADIRSITSGQGSCRTRRRNVPGQARYGAAPCGRDHHRRCEPRAGGLPSTLQRPLQGTCAGVGSRLSRCGRRGASGSCSVLQVPAQSRQGQHGQIPLAHTSTAARQGPAELRRGSRECA